MSLLVVDVGQALRLAWRRRGGADEHQLPPTHGECERRRRHGRRLDVLRFDLGKPKQQQDEILKCVVRYSKMHA